MESVPLVRGPLIPRGGSATISGPMRARRTSPERSFETAASGRSDVLAALAFVSGAAAMVFELVWARWLALDVGAGSEGLALAVAGTMLGLALGGELGGRWADRRPRRLFLFGLLQV